MVSFSVYLNAIVVRRFFLPCSKAKQSFKFRLFSSPSPFTRAKLTQLNWSCPTQLCFPCCPCQAFFVVSLPLSGHSFSHTLENPTVFWGRELAGLQKHTVHTANINALCSTSSHALASLSSPLMKASLGFTNRNCQYAHAADRQQNVKVLLTQFEEEMWISQHQPSHF